MLKEVTLTLVVTAPVTANENQIARRINEALDEPPNDWGNWTVSGVSITNVNIIGQED